MGPFFFAPDPVLRKFVNSIMIDQVGFDKTIRRPVFPLPPFPEQCLFFYPHDPIDVESADGKRHASIPDCIIVGPRTERINISPGHHHFVIKVSFQPGGLFRLLGIPMQELLGADSIDARDIFGNEPTIILEQLNEATSLYEMKKLIDQYLLPKMGKLKQYLPIDTALVLLIKGGGLLSIDQLASTACLSSRQFERAFKERIGLSPKFFSRLVRFSRAWLIKENDTSVSWTKIAHRCGYYDQMHFIRDFKEFAGANPSLITSSLRKRPVNLKNGTFF